MVRPKWHFIVNLKSRSCCNAPLLQAGVSSVWSFIGNSGTLQTRTQNNFSNMRKEGVFGWLNGMLPIKRKIGELLKTAII